MDDFDGTDFDSIIVRSQVQAKQHVDAVSQQMEEPQADAFAPETTVKADAPPVDWNFLATSDAQN